MDMADDDVFINSNAPNVNVDGDELEDVQADFESKMGPVAFDVCDDGPFPVLYYTLNGKSVAWVDLENRYGYVAKR